METKRQMRDYEDQKQLKDYFTPKINKKRSKSAGK